MENSSKLYKSAGNCDYRQHYMAIIESLVIYNPEGLAENSPITVSTLVDQKNQSARKLLSQFLAPLDDKQKLLSAD